MSYTLPSHQLAHLLEFMVVFWLIAAFGMLLLHIDSVVTEKMEKDQQLTDQYSQVSGDF